MQLGQAGAPLEVGECCLQAEVVDHRLRAYALLPVQLFGHLLLYEHSWRLVQPGVLPRLAGDQVAHPAVAHLVDGRRDLGLVARDHRRRDEGQHRILHAAERKRGRQHQHVVCAPGVGEADVLLNLV